ncbi:hypothetical protein [Mannheimia haemolytica]
MKSFKFHEDFIAQLEQLAEQHGISQTQVIVQAVEQFSKGA